MSSLEYPKRGSKVFTGSESGIIPSSLQLLKSLLNIALIKS